MNTSIENLAAEAGERITDFELVRDVVFQYRERGENHLGFEPFVAGNGLVYCIASRLTSLGDKDRSDQLRLENGALHRDRTYNTLGVQVDFVGLWPEAGEAALYRLETSLTPASEHAETPFKEAAETIISKDNGAYSHSRYRQQAETSDGSVILSADYINGTPILATPTTRLTATEKAINAIDNEVAVDVSLSGPAFIDLPARHLVKITSEGVFVSPDTPSKLPLEIPEGHPSATTRLRLNEKTEPKINEEGLLVRPGRGDDNPKYNNPSIKTLDALDLATTGLTWNDETTTFLEKMRSQLLDLCVIDPATSYENIAAQAREAIAEFLAQNQVEPRAIGCLAVSQRLGAMASERHNERDLVTPRSIGHYGRLMPSRTN